MSNPFAAKPHGEPVDSFEDAPPSPVARPQISSGPAEAQGSVVPENSAGVAPKPSHASPPASLSSPALAHPQAPPAMPPLEMDEVSCRTCRFFEFSARDRGNAVSGECRRNAPVPGNDKAASWPSVGWDAWCGEWETGISEEDMVSMARAAVDRMVNGPAASFLSSAPSQRHDSGAS